MLLRPFRTNASWIWTRKNKILCLTDVVIYDMCLCWELMTSFFHHFLQHDCCSLICCISYLQRSSLFPFLAAQLLYSHRNEAQRQSHHPEPPSVAMSLSGKSLMHTWMTLRNRFDIKTFLCFFVQHGVMLSLLHSVSASSSLILICIASISSYLQSNFQLSSVTSGLKIIQDLWFGMPLGLCFLSANDLG